MRILVALFAVGIVVLVGCDENGTDRFTGTWRNDQRGETIEIGARGFGTARVLSYDEPRPFTWKRGTSDRIVMEFGETASKRREFEGRLTDDDSLVVRHQNSSTTLRRVKKYGGSSRP